MPRRARTTDRGFSLVEALVVMLFIGVMMTLLVQSLFTLGGTQRFSRTQATLWSFAERVMRSIENDLHLASRVFTADELPGDFVGRLEFPQGRHLWLDSRLPARTARGCFVVDPPGSEETGNLLLLARSGRALIVDLGSAGAADPVRVDAQHFVLYGMARDPGDSEPRLVRWQGAPMARYADLIGIEDPERRSRVLRALYLEGVRMAWDANALEQGGGLFAIEARGELRGGLESVPPDPERGWALPGSPSVAIARNGAEPRVAVPLYAEPSESGTFPGGFEIKADGPSNAKLMLVRMVVVASGRERNHVTLSRLVHASGG